MNSPIKKFMRRVKDAIWFKRHCQGYTWDKAWEVAGTVLYG